MQNTKQDLFTVLLLILTFIIVGCAADDADVVAQADYDALKQQLNKSESAVAQLTGEHESLKKDFEDFQADYAALEQELVESRNIISQQTDEIESLYKLTEKYKNLSDSEILAQTEANNLKAEEDRIEKEKLLAEEQAKKDAEAEAIRLAEEKEAKLGYETGITYNNLARTPDDYVNKKVKFTGRVVQVIEGNNEINLRIATKGSYDNVILVYYTPDIVKSRVLENDKITIYGISKGLHTYESTMGASITVPLIAVDKIDQ